MSKLEALLQSLRGIAESSRLRILAALSNGELTVSELTEVLGQSQPRVSRHLKLLCDAGLIERHQEGSWVFHRLADHPVLDAFRQCIPRDDHIIRQDLQRLKGVRDSHRARAARYFQRNARRWDRIRERHASERRVERRLLEIVGERRFRRHVDLGTGTGRILQVFAPRSRAALGIDNNREMLAVARSNLAGEDYVHCQARHGDILGTDIEDGAADLVTLHHVLHYLENPSAAIVEAARIVDRDGIVVVVDFAPHHNEALRNEFAHRRLGFDETEVVGFLEDAGLVCRLVETVTGRRSDSPLNDELDVILWIGARSANQTSVSTSNYQ